MWKLSLGSWWRASNFSREREGLCELIHAARLMPRTVSSRLEYHRALMTGEECNCCPAACIVRDTPARAVVLQVGVNLRTHCHRGSPYRAFDRATLLDRENALSCNIDIRSMLTSLKEGYFILTSIDAKGNIKTTFVAVQAVELDARETFLARIAGIVMLLQKECQLMIYHDRKVETTG